MLIYDIINMLMYDITKYAFICLNKSKQLSTVCMHNMPCACLHSNTQFTYSLSCTINY